MDEEWFRKMLIESHNNQRHHMKRIIDGLTEEHLLTPVPADKDAADIRSLLWHIGSAETYWFHKSGHSIGSRFGPESIEVVMKKLDENTDRIAEVINTCSVEQLRIVPPSPEGGPSVAWALLRTFMHGVYHTGQIARLRRILGAPDLPEDDHGTWDRAVDSVAVLIHGLLHDSIPS